MCVRVPDTIKNQARRWASNFPAGYTGSGVPTNIDGSWSSWDPGTLWLLEICRVVNGLENNGLVRPGCAFLNTAVTKQDPPRENSSQRSRIQ